MSQFRRRQLLIAAGALLAAPLGQAQRPATVARVGFLCASDATTLANYLDAFRQGLSERGYVEGRNTLIYFRFAEGKYERLPGFATELVNLKVDAIVIEGSASAQAAKNATRTIPIVMAQAGDPISAGFIQSLARPGANITGVTTLSLGLVGKQLEILKDIVPGLAQAAVLWDPNHPGHPPAMPAIRTAARALGLELQLVEVRSVKELEKAFENLARKRPGAITAVSDPIYDSQQKRIADFAMQNNLPSAYTKAYAEKGGLISYGARFPDLYKRAADYVDKIIKGAKPADLPVEQPTRFELILNLITARRLGLKISRDFLARVDDIIQ